MDEAWNAFFKSTMEKTAIIGSALYGGLSLVTLKDKNQELQNISRINPVQRGQDSSLKLKPSYAYQFEGGKRTGGIPAVNPRRM